jgi:uracil-DNA glycosylase family 4
VTPRIDPAGVEVVRSATACPDLATLGSRTAGCVACPELAATRRCVVAGDFPAGARLLVVGEAPGAQEDECGRPFVGRGGQLLDRLLGEAGVDRASVAVANVLKCRPPGNRTPTRAEANRCRGWLDRQVQLLDPRLVVTLGGTALAWALGTGHRLYDVRGRLHEWNGRLLLATYHPSAALRFGPAGAPMAALRADLVLAAQALAARA